jgi:hypothetical protein
MNVDAINSLRNMKEFHGQKLLFIDRITKLTSEIIELKAKLTIFENEKLKTDKKLDKAMLILKKFTTANADNDSKTSSSANKNNDKNIDLNYLLYQADTNEFTVQYNNQTKSNDHQNNNINDTTITAATSALTTLTTPSQQQQKDDSVLLKNKLIEQELHRQIDILEKQLAESESLKSKTEMTLTERVARPLTQTEVKSLNFCFVLYCVLQKLQKFYRFFYTIFIRFFIGASQRHEESDGRVETTV